MRRTAYQPGQVLDCGVITIHRVRDVHTHPAMQMVTDLHHRGCLQSKPITEAVEIVVGIAAFGDTTTTALSVVTTIHSACSAYGTAILVPFSRPLANVVAGRSGSGAPGSLSAAVSTAPFATPAR